MLMPSVNTGTDLYTRPTLKIKWRLERDGASFGQVSQFPITKHIVLKHIRNNGINMKRVKATRMASLDFHSCTPSALTRLIQQKLLVNYY
jgi:hypothetical protein